MVVVYGCTSDARSEARNDVRVETPGKLIRLNYATDIAAIDGDTVRIDGIVYRLQGFDTPETSRAKCENERVAGIIAKLRVAQLIRSNRGDLWIEPALDRDGLYAVDRYNRRLGRLYIDTRDLAAIMIEADLAYSYICPNGRCPKRRDWCAWFDATRAASEPREASSSIPASAEPQSWWRNLIRRVGL